MECTIHTVNQIKIAEVRETDGPIDSEQAFLDLIVNLPTNRLAVYKEAVADDFFDLKSGLAGAILQKASNYRIYLGIIGDFSAYTSKSLQDFMRESNKTGQIVFADSIEHVLRIFSKG